MKNKSGEPVPTIRVITPTGVIEAVDRMHSAATGADRHCSSVAFWAGYDGGPMPLLVAGSSSLDKYKEEWLS